MILFGHPSGNPNSHHAALAHWEAGNLEAFCVPWFPEKWELALLKGVPGLGKEAERLSRRRFEPLAPAPKVQGRLGEWSRLVRRKMGGGEELSYEANDWLMRTMAKEAGKPWVKGIHSYEDCSLWQFQAAKRRGKACIYDMPIGYYGWWQQKEKELARKYRDWLPPEGISSTRFARPEQKKKEMELADVVVTACTFAANTIRQSFDKKVVIAPYGVDLPSLEPSHPRESPFRIIYAGAASVRKGVPLLLEVWRDLAWKDAELILAGSWQLASARAAQLPPGVRYLGMMSQKQVNQEISKSDWLILPSNFEGYGLVILEALANGVPVIASTATGAGDLGPSPAIKLMEPDSRDSLAEALQQAKKSRKPGLQDEARRVASVASWDRYREKVVSVAEKFL